MSKFTLRLDSSQIVAAWKCTTFHQLAYVENLQRKRENRAAMDRGTVMHGLLERFYTKIWEREQWPAAMNFSVGCLNDLKIHKGLTDDDYKLVLARFMDYCVKWNPHKEEILTMADGKPAVERGFSVELVDNDLFYFVLEGRIDLVTLASEQHVVWDHKSQSRKYWLYGHSVQALNYSLVTDCTTFMYNYVRLHAKVQPDTFDRKPHYMPSWLMKHWKAKVIQIFYRIANARMAGQFFENDFPNPHCSDMSFGKKCPMTSICEEYRHPQIQKQIIARDYEQRQPWEPWSLEETGTEEE